MVWDIFDELRRMQEEMDKMFSDFFQRPYYLGPGRTGREVMPQERMPMMREALVDVRETDKEIAVTAELPGMNKEDIELNVTEDRVEIRVQKKEKKKEEKEGYKAYGRRYMGFYKSFPLSTPVKSEDARATYKNGVLEVILPKKEVTKSRTISVE